MAKVWITYAWEDNQELEVDYIAQELIRSGLEIKLDRWNIGAGKRLWEQIENFIRDPSESDAWVLYATQNSLSSEPCKEEYSYALRRALSLRGNSYPIIGLFPTSIDDDLIPAGISSRLYVSITDPDWKERIKSAAEKHLPQIKSLDIPPYVVHAYSFDKHPISNLIYEFRPRAGSWCPFFAAIPIGEKNSVNPQLFQGPINNPPNNNAFLFMGGEGMSNDKKWFMLTSQTEGTPTQSFYLFCKMIPSKIYFGVFNGHPQYQIKTIEIN
jgi:hypothetical protein